MSQLIAAITDLPSKIADQVATKVFANEDQAAKDAVTVQTQQATAPQTVKPATEHWFWKRWGSS
jgi:hypothetical protein